MVKIMVDTSKKNLVEDEKPTFRLFTRESLAAVQAKIAEDNAREKALAKKVQAGVVR